MKRVYVLRGALCVLTLALLSAIYVMSAQPADSSTEASLAVGRAVGGLIVPGYAGLTESEQTAYAVKIDHTVRKTAHFIEFFALGALFSADALAWDLKVRAATPLSFAAGAVCAALDELHQTFVPGRAGMWQDVLLDCAGVAAGVAAVFAAALIIKRIKNDRRAR